MVADDDNEEGNAAFARFILDGGDKRKKKSGWTILKSTGVIILGAAVVLLVIALGICLFKIGSLEREFSSNAEISALLQVGLDRLNVSLREAEDRLGGRWNLTSQGLRNETDKIEG